MFFKKQFTLCLLGLIPFSTLFPENRISEYGDKKLRGIIYLPKDKNTGQFTSKVDKYFIRLKNYQIFRNGKDGWDMSNDSLSFSIVKETCYDPKYKIKTNKKSLQRLGYSKKLISKVFSKQSLKENKLEFMMNFWLTFSNDLKNGIRVDKTIDTGKGRFRVLSAFVDRRDIIKIIRKYHPNFYSLDSYKKRLPFFISYVGEIFLTNGSRFKQNGFLLSYYTSVINKGLIEENNYNLLLNLRVSKLTNKWNDYDRNHEFLFKDQLARKCPDERSTETCYHIVNSLPLPLNAGKGGLFLMLEKFEYSNTLAWENGKWNLKDIEGVDLRMPSGCSDGYEYTYPLD